MRTFGINEELPEAQLVGQVLLEGLATGATATVVGVGCFQANSDNVICLHPEPESKNCAEGFAL